MTTKSNTPDNPDMSKQDNEFFDAYLGGDSSLSEMYNTIDCAEPSNKLNQSILSAAKASAQPSSASKHWWTQTGSWAASIAVISLVGILTHNTWQTEQDAVHKEIHGVIAEESLDSPLKHNNLQPGRQAKAETASSIEKAKITADTPVEQKIQVLQQAKKSFSRDKSKDSRQLLYKSPPVPVMQSAPASFTAKKAEPLLLESDIQQFADGIPVPQAIEKKRPLTKQQIELDKIAQLIENNEINQAQELLLQFKIKYPDYPIDPVILKYLSPY